MLTKLLGINWKTTLAGLSAIATSIGIIVNAWRTKDFATIFTQSQTLIPIVSTFIIGLIGVFAKDKSVTGAGTQAVLVQSDGTIIDTSGKDVGKQLP